jgi:hypothetical protein
MKYGIVWFGCLFSFHIGLCQKDTSTSVNNYQQLLSSAMVRGHFIYETPLSKPVAPSISYDYFKDYACNKDGVADSARYRQFVDSAVYSELVKNSMVTNNRPWTRKELNGFVLVKTSEQAGNHVIFRYARPVFDRKKEYALIQYTCGTHLDDKHGCSGRGMIILHRENGVWKELRGVVTLR